jgi:uncharacterized protein YndB with AHSA1/START domain
MSVSHAAPVIAAGEIYIIANPATVWEVITDIERWPAWNPDVKETSLHGDVAEGTQFRWKVRTGTISSTLTRVDPPLVLAWNGKGFGVKAIHVWRLEPHDRGTLVKTEESWEGLLSRILRASFQKALQKSIDTGLRHLKAEAERRERG